MVIGPLHFLIFCGWGKVVGGVWLVALVVGDPPVSQSTNSLNVLTVLTFITFVG